MSVPPNFNELLTEAARGMDVQTSTSETLQAAVELAVSIVDGCDMAAISLVRKTHLDTPYVTDETLRLLDQEQFGLKEGPCVETLRELEMVSSNRPRS